MIEVVGVVGRRGKIRHRRRGWGHIKHAVHRHALWRHMICKSNVYVLTKKAQCIFISKNWMKTKVQQNLNITRPYVAKFELKLILSELDGRGHSLDFIDLL